MSAQTIHKSQKVSKADVVFNIILYGICGLILLLIAYPLYFIIIASFSMTGPESTQSFPFPSVSSAIRCSPLQIFSTGAAMAWLPPFKTAAAFSMHWT